MLVLKGLPNPEIRGLGIVIKNGKPDLSDDFVRHLTPTQREAVDRALRIHGFVLAGNEILEIE